MTVWSEDVASTLEGETVMLCNTGGAASPPWSFTIRTAGADSSGPRLRASIGRIHDVVGSYVMKDESIERNAPRRGTLAIVTVPVKMPSEGVPDVRLR